MTYVVFEGIEAAEPRDPPEWIGGADYYLAEWGEYERSGASWSFKKTLREAIRRSVNGQWFGDSFDVIAKLRIYGKRSHKTWRYRPTGWYVSIEFGKYGYEDKTFRGKCRSVSEALRAASAAITDQHIHAVVALAYSRNRMTRSVYRLKDEAPVQRPPLDYWSTPSYAPEVLHDPANWEPWASDCGTSHDWANWLPRGRYLELDREPDGTLRGFFINQGGGSTCGQGSAEFTQLARTLGGWTCSETERLIDVAPHQVWGCFRDDATVKFETHVDPTSGFEQRFIVIETKLGVEEADQKLRKLEDQWWLKVMPADGSLALELRHVSA